MPSKKPVYFGSSRDRWWKRRLCPDLVSISELVVYGHASDRGAKQLAGTRDVPQGKWLGVHGTLVGSKGDNRVLNLLRSLSAFAVVLGHVRLLFIEDYADAPHTALTAFLYALTSLGSQAVIVFFVLSGYFVGGGVISRFRRHTFSWFDYGNSRLTRLWLVLIPALILTLVFDLTGHSFFGSAAEYSSPSSYVGMNRDPTLDPLTFVGNVVFLQGLHVPIYGTNNPLWSLAFEAWYYLMFPAILSLLWRGQSLRARGGGALLLVGGLVVSGPAVLLLFPCWLLGALVGAYRLQIANALGRLSGTPRVTLRALMIAATMAVAIAVRLQTGLPLRSDAWLLAVVAAATVAVFVTDVSWRGWADRTLELFSRTAHSSYSLYAVHMPIIVIVAAWIIPDPELRVPMTPLGLSACIGLVVAIWVIAHCFATVTEMRTDRLKAQLERLGRGVRVRSIKRSRRLAGKS